MPGHSDVNCIDGCVETHFTPLTGSAKFLQWEQNPLTGKIYHIKGLENIFQVVFQCERLALSLLSLIEHKGLLDAALRNNSYEEVYDGKISSNRR